MLPDLEGRDISVTGAGGFIGSAVVGALARHGARVRALTGAPGDPVRNLPPGVTTWCGDITNRSVIDELMPGVDVVIHLAGPPSVAASFDLPGEYARVHVAGTATVVDACRRWRVRRLVY